MLIITGCNSTDNLPVEEEIVEEEVIEFGDPGKEAIDCFPAFEDDELNVATWNIKFFPTEGDLTIGKVVEVIDALDADIIAVQEIANGSEFIALSSELDGWGAVYSNVRYGQELGFLYKKSAFPEFGELTQLFDNDSDAFPRQVVRVDATHVSGLEVVFMNLHLKCCGADGSEEQERRKSASEQIKLYIDENLADDAVIVLGDFNDEIEGVSSPFQNFIDDANYTFADAEIGLGPEANWSYPSWPSHIDHILISDELFDKVNGVQTLLLEQCIINYSTTVSDHRPVLASFK